MIKEIATIMLMGSCLIKANMIRQTLIIVNIITAGCTDKYMNGKIVPSITITITIMNKNHQPLCFIVSNSPLYTKC